MPVDCSTSQHDGGDAVAAHITLAYTRGHMLKSDLDGERARLAKYYASLT